ncbi:MAG: endolytic transglycosylase MltG, partial [Treponema sp.]|nr:endolytic transglycosylase MltG [Treponema sp.]
WKGLPPGPISNPGMVALKACIKPAETKYFYFRVTDPSAGRHTFSETFDEHAKVGLMYTKKAASK